MKISIITVTINSEATIEDTILSVAGQTYPDAEHIIIDGASTDGTRDIIRKHQDKLARWVSEPDQGMYDAMNKGLKYAKGDILGFLHSDDVYADNDIITNVVNIFKSNKVDAVFGDLVYVAPDNLNGVVRYYDSSLFNPDMIARGYMPAHPTLFFREGVYKNYGYFKTNYRIAADFEYVARVFGKGRISYHYSPKVMVKMRTGGKSTNSLKSNWILNQEIFKACSENGIKTNYFKIYSKYPRKVIGLIRKNPRLIKPASINKPTQ